MTKSELKTGMIVTTRKGNEYMVMLNAHLPNYDTNNFLIRQEGYLDLDTYQENLMHYFGQTDEFDIMKVEYLRCVTHAFNYQNSNRILLWERQEAKKMTVAEIEAILGYKIEVVSEQ